MIAYLGFISLGLPDTLIGVAWPSVRKTFGLQQSDISWIFFGGGCSYFLSSFFAGRMLKVFNVGVLLAISSGLVAISGFDYALARAWPLFALGSIFHGLGSGAIDTGLNHYVSNHFSAKHMNWLHACYSLGAMLGPLIMTAMITRADSFRLGYAVVATMLLTLSLMFFLTRARWDEPEKPATPAEGSPKPKQTTAMDVLRNRVAWLQIILFFIYTGLEVAVGQWSFTVLTESRGISKEVAGLWVTIYWGSIFAGRILFGFVLDKIGIDRVIRYSNVAAVAGTLLFSWNPAPWASPLGLALAGLGLASFFPCMMTRTPQRLGKEMAAHAIGFQVGAAMLGAAALPSLSGFVAQHVGLSYVAITTLSMAIALFLLHEVLLLSTNSQVQPKA
ncbi:MAG: MFS transporter [Verrucomicrobiales bacterium]